jgi:hypothetical protein
MAGWARRRQCFAGRDALARHSFGACAADAPSCAVRAGGRWCGGPGRHAWPLALAAANGADGAAYRPWTATEPPSGRWQPARSGAWHRCIGAAVPPASRGSSAAGRNPARRSP